MTTNEPKDQLTLETRPPAYLHGKRIYTYGPLTSEIESYKPWAPPKLSEGGRAFAPAPNAPGSKVIFEHNGVRMVGEVWADGPGGGDLWVVREQVAYLVGR